MYHLVKVGHTTGNEEVQLQQSTRTMLGSKMHNRFGFSTMRKHHVVSFIPVILILSVLLSVLSSPSVLISSLRSLLSCVCQKESM